MTSREDLVLEIVRGIEQEKVKNGIAPNHATLNEITKLVQESLRELWRQKRVKVGDTINDKYISIIEEHSK